MNEKTKHMLSELQAGYEGKAPHAIAMRKINNITDKYELILNKKYDDAINFLIYIIESCDKNFDIHIFWGLEFLDSLLLIYTQIGVDDIKQEDYERFKSALDEEISNIKPPLSKYRGKIREAIEAYEKKSNDRKLLTNIDEHKEIGEVLHKNITVPITKLFEINCKYYINKPGNPIFERIEGESPTHCAIKFIKSIKRFEDAVILFKGTQNLQDLIDKLSSNEGHHGYHLVNNIN